MGTLANLIRTLIFVVLVGGTTMVLIPVYLLSSFSSQTNVEIGFLRYFGFLPFLLGIIIISWCVRDFIYKGKGTPAPYDPPKQLVVNGLFRFMRNPIITGGIMILVGESILMESAAIACWALIFFIGNHIYFIFWEEPGLIKRVGEDYEIYMKNVPRWFPRFTNKRTKSTEND